jgi:hypothetical protein
MMQRKAEFDSGDPYGMVIGEVSGQVNIKTQNKRLKPSIWLPATNGNTYWIAAVVSVFQTTISRI